MKVQSGEVPQVTRGIGPMRLLVDNWISLRDLNNPISWGMIAESLFLKRCKVVKFLKFPMEGGIGPLKLLKANVRKLRDVRNPSWWGIILVKWLKLKSRTVINLERLPMLIGMVP